MRKLSTMDAHGFDIALGQIMQMIRLEKGVSRSKAIEAAEVSGTTFSRFENGESSMSARVVVLLCEEYGVNVGEVLQSADNCSQSESVTALNKVLDKDPGSIQAIADLLSEDETTMEILKAVSQISPECRKMLLQMIKPLQEYHCEPKK